MKSPDDEYSDGLEAELEALRKENAELLEQNAQLEADAAHLGPFYERQLSTLQSKYDALLVAIEAKDAALHAVAHGLNPWAMNSVLEALALSTSTELLEERDRKRDAKLLRLVANSGALSSYGIKYVFHKVKLRESGEWIPELGE